MSRYYVGSDMHRESIGLAVNYHLKHRWREDMLHFKPLRHLIRRAGLVSRRNLLSLHIA